MKSARQGLKMKNELVVVDLQEGRIKEEQETKWKRGGVEGGREEMVYPFHQGVATSVADLWIRRMDAQPLDAPTTRCPVSQGLCTVSSVLTPF